MQDFKQQLKAYSDEMRNTRCPYSEAELDKEIRSVIWNIPQKECGNVGMCECVNLSTNELTHSRINTFTAAAAIVAAIIIPTAILMKSGTAGEIASIDIDGEHIYFACNNGCTPEGTLQNFKALIQ